MSLPQYSKGLLKDVRADGVHQGMRDVSSCIYSLRVAVWGKITEATQKPGPFINSLFFSSPVFGKIKI